MISLVFPQAQNCVRFSQVFNVDNDPQTLIRQQAPNSELSGPRPPCLPSGEPSSRVSWFSSFDSACRDSNNPWIISVSSSNS